MVSVASSFNQAVRLHLAASAAAAAARGRLAVSAPAVPVIEPDGGLRSLTRRLCERAAALAPGWLGDDLQATGTTGTTDRSTAGGTARHAGAGIAPGRPGFVRVGRAVLPPSGGFPVVLPFLGAGHLAIDADVTDSHIAGWLRAILLRCLAALPQGLVRVRLVDGRTLGTAFAVYRAWLDGDTWPAPETDADGLRRVLAEAEQRIAAPDVSSSAGGQQPGDGRANGTSRRRDGYLIVVLAGWPPGAGAAEWERLAAVGHAGPAAGVHLLLAGHPPRRQPGLAAPPPLAHTTYLSRGDDGLVRVSEPCGPHRFSGDGTGLPVPVRLDPAPPDALVAAVCREVATGTRTAVTFDALMPDRIWTRSSAAGLSTVVGTHEGGRYPLALDDATPHWLIGGRTGSGKTVFLLNALYGLACRYGPDELGLYLLDFKEGVSFTEFTPTPADPSWVPHARTVGVESDREYGLAVLRALAAEMADRAVMFKQAGVTRLAELRAARPRARLPRLVAVIDEFQVLFAGDDRAAARAAALLEDLARKGRSYGIHLILASQTISGVEALFTKTESIFGQFPVRVALAGGGGVLDRLNQVADGLPVGVAIVNDGGGLTPANHVVRFPDADRATVAARRRALWAARPAGSAPPAIFAGYAGYHLADDPGFQRLVPDGSARPRVLVGRVVDVGLPTAAFGLDANPGRHVAVLGPSAAGADVLHAAVASLARQHPPDQATFLLAPLAPGITAVVEDTVAAIRAGGHRYQMLDTAGLRERLVAFAAAGGAGGAGGGPGPRYLVIFGADAASGALATPDPATYRAGTDDLRDVLEFGPARGLHVLGWWRGMRRFADDTGAGGREGFACLVVLNVGGSDLAAYLGDYELDWRPRPNRALLVDRHRDRRSLIVPFVRLGLERSMEEP